MVSFNAIPTTLRVPFTYVEFDNSKAVQGASAQPFATLLMGQKLSTGSEPELTLKTVTNVEQAVSLYGRGSSIHRMVEYYLANNSVIELKVMAIDDLAAGVNATGKLTISGPATADGVINLYVAGQKVVVGVSSGDSADDVAAAIAAKLPATSDMPLSAVVNGTNADEVDMIAKHKGEIGNVDVRVNYLDSEELPAGVGVAITAMNGGTGNPDISEIISALPDEQFNTVINPWTDGTNLSALETEMADRWGPIRQNAGLCIAYKLGTLSNLQVLGNSRNSKHSCIVGPAKSAPNPAYEWAAAKAGAVSVAAATDPARPFQTLALAGIMSPKSSEQFTLTERNILLSDGIATDKAAAGGVVQIERLITTYQTNAAGSPDTSFLDANTVYTLDYLRYDFRTQMSSKFPRHKLRSDGQQAAAGQAILTPRGAKAEAIGIFQGWLDLALVEGIEQFQADLVVERNTQDPTRLDFLLTPDLANQLRVLGTQIQFLL